MASWALKLTVTGESKFNRASHDLETRCLAIVSMSVMSGCIHAAKSFESWKMKWWMSNVAILETRRVPAADPGLREKSGERQVSKRNIPLNEPHSAEEPREREAC